MIRQCVIYGKGGIDDSDNSYMTLSNPMDCIGCEACSRVCPKACFTHEALPLVA